MHSRRLFSLLLSPFLYLCLVAIFLLPSQALFSKDLAKHLSPAYLQALHEEAKQLKRERVEIPPLRGLQDIKVVLHAHSSLSHDSEGKVEEIIAAAKKGRIRAIFMSEHPRKDLDVIANGLSGLKDGIYFFPGAETNQFLIYPTDKKMIDRSLPQQAIIDQIVSGGGLIFIAHTEEQKDWSIHGMTGMEIYNTHYDMLKEIPKSKKALAKILTGKNLQLLLQGFSKYPVEAFASLFDPPKKYLEPYDKLTQKQKIVGIAANDSHQNVKIFGLQLDPYEVSLGYVGTHLWVKDVKPKAIVEALKEGHAYVAFDWLADPTGFRLTAESDKTDMLMGDEMQWTPQITLDVKVPLKHCVVDILRNGKRVKTLSAPPFRFKLSKRGVYRVVVKIKLNKVDELRPWIYSNPLYLR